MTELNSRYTGRRGSTDVLAFPLEEGEYLGEVIISLESCRRQSILRQVSFQEELSLLVVHGVLHLAGYDHTEDKDSEERMRNLETEVLARLGFGS